MLNMLSIPAITLLCSVLLCQCVQDWPGNDDCFTQEEEGYVSMLQTAAASFQRNDVPCDLPTTPDFGEIIAGSQVTPPVSSSYVPSGVTLVPRHSTEFNNTLFSLIPKPGNSLFGDRGFLLNAWGGIFSYDVFKTSVELSLYGLRYNATKHPFAYEDVWFTDSFDNPDGAGPLTWAEYSNKVAATCWEYTMAMQCNFTAGTYMVLGSGAWRDTSIPTMCEFPAGTAPFPGQEIITPQKPKPSILQYVVDPKANRASCCVAPVNPDDLAGSFLSGCQQVNFDLLLSDAMSGLAKHHGRYKWIPQ